jgi:hypothetical protein
VTLIPLHDFVCVPTASRKARCFGVILELFHCRLAGKIALFTALCFLAASQMAAQDQSAPPQNTPPPVSVGAPASGPYPLPTQYAGQAAGQWQIAEAYQFNHIAFRGALPSFSTVGFNSSVSRFFGRDVALEGDLGAGFGSPASGTSANSIFLGVGPRLALRGRRHFEPWGHGLVGLQHFSVGATNFPINESSLAWIAGGGVDYRFNSGIGFRVQVDYLGSHFVGVFQRNLQIVTGVVWNF